MSSEPPIITSLELVAERAGDVTPAIIETYHTRCPEAVSLMDHMDRHMLGRMVDQVLLLLMEDGDAELDAYLEFETANHTAYGVEPDMYAPLFEAVLETVRTAAGSDWTEELEQAWRARITHLDGELVAASART